MSYHLEVLQHTRQNTLKVVAGLSLAQLTTIPNGFSNHLAWNLGHVIVTLHRLCYLRAGLPSSLSDEMMDAYKKGSFASQDTTEEEITELKKLALETIDDLKADLKVGKFQQYEAYQTSYGVHLGSIEEALTFNNVHEAMHLGYMKALRQQVDV
ncbi:MAG: DinB family protein [Bacteroidota bacterium]